MDWSFRALSLKNSRSGFMNLPQEIRDLIFEFALTSSKPMVSFRLDEYQRQGYEEAVQPPLTRVNRQIRKESLPIFYDCNNIALHTEKSKIDDTQRWLQCIESKLSMLNRISLWIRYVTLTHEVTPSNGAMSITMQRTKPDGIWSVHEWCWVTVKKMPSIVRRDAEFLIGKLRTMLQDEPSYVASAEGFFGLMSDLKTFYIKEKMS